MKKILCVTYLLLLTSISLKSITLQDLMAQGDGYALIKDIITLDKLQKSTLLAEAQKQSNDLKGQKKDLTKSTREQFKLKYPQITTTRSLYANKEAFSDWMKLEKKRSEKAKELDDKLQNLKNIISLLEGNNPFGFLQKQIKATTRFL